MEHTQLVPDYRQFDEEVFHLLMKLYLLAVHAARRQELKVYLVSEAPVMATGSPEIVHKSFLLMSMAS